MKKLFIILTVFFFSMISFAQERELSDYEKYRMEQEKKLYGTDEEVFYIVEDMPKFKGQNAKFFRVWIAENVRYPKEAAENGIEGKVMVSFVVNKEGNITYAKIEEGDDIYLNAEALRVVTASPKWKPGKQRGVPVNVQFTFPINFVLDKTPVEESVEDPVVINNYYIDNQPDYRRSLYFGYDPYFSGYYNPYYYYGYPTYGSWYGGYYNYYAYYGSYYPYYGNYWGHNHYYGYGNYYGSSGRYYTSLNRHYYNPYYKTYRSGYVSLPTSSKKSVMSTRPQTTRQAATRSQTTKQITTRPQTTRQAATRSTTNYSPRYNKPSTTSRPSYNKPMNRVRSTTATGTRSQTKSTTRSSTTYSRPSATKSSRPTPSRSSYSSPSRSSSSYSRPSSSSSSGRSYSSGSSSRSSGSSSAGRSSSSGGGKKR